ncbi:hypothetical protein D9M72_521270 [compost metagenome]
MGVQHRHFTQHGIRMATDRLCIDAAGVRHPAGLVGFPVSGELVAGVVVFVLQLLGQVDQARRNELPRQHRVGQDEERIPALPDLLDGVRVAAEEIAAVGHRVHELAGPVPDFQDADYLLVIA